MSILLIGEHYSTNLGDPLISECYQWILKNKSISYEILDLSGNVKDDTDRLDEIDISETFDRTKKYKAYNFIRAIINAIRSKRIIDNVEINESIHAAIYIGGSIFMSYFAMKQYCLNKKLTLREIPIFYSACGMGKISFGFEKQMMKKALRHISANRITLRDSEEYFYKEFNITPKKTEDIALLVNDYIILNYKPEITMGIGFMSLNSRFDSELEKNYIEFIKLLEMKQIRWELFTNGSVDDYCAMKHFYYKLRENGLIRYGGYCTRPKTTKDLVGQITRYEKIITCRLHSAIIAYSYQIPTVAINWTNKIADFYKHINHEELIIDLGFDPYEILSLLIHIAYTEKDANRLKDMQEDALENVQNIIGEIERLEHGE